VTCPEAQVIHSKAKLRGIFGQFLRFAVVGIAGTTVHYGVLIMTVQWLGIPAVVGSSIGFLLGALTNYFFNYRFTFRSKRRHREAVPRFYAVAAAGFVLNGSILAFLMSFWDLYYLWSQIFATAIVLLWNFSANFVWTFAKSGSE
jgi:putative flippase GtrA